MVSITRFLIARKLCSWSVEVAKYITSKGSSQVVLVDVVLSTPSIRDIRVGILEQMLRTVGNNSERWLTKDCEGSGIEVGSREDGRRISGVTDNFRVVKGRNAVRDQIRAAI